MKINAPLEHKETIQMIIKQNIYLFAEKDTDLGRTQTIGMSIDTGSHLPKS